MTKLLLATTNQKKLAEMRLLLKNLGFDLVGLDDMETSIEVEETGSTFTENATLKATQQAVYHGMPTIGEDSGLSVDALDGEPGIYSARYSGDGATDDKNIDLLLTNLAPYRASDKHLSAHYSSAVVLSAPNGEVLLSTYDECHGRILESRRGDGGFGYDPIFEIAEYHQTFAELGSTVKSQLSHRGRALRSFLDRLRFLDLGISIRNN